MDLAYNLMRGIIGIVIMLAICYLLSSNRKSINWRLVGGGIFLQLILAILILKVPFVYAIFKGNKFFKQGRRSLQALIMENYVY